MKQLILTDEQILSTVKGECKYPDLQVAYDRMLLCSQPPGTQEYAETWKTYLKVGGTLNCLPPGIDRDNWLRHRKAV